MTIPPENPPQTHATFEWQRPPVVKSPLTPPDVLDRLVTASKRGRMPGFVRVGTDSFAVDLFGVPWDRALVGMVTPDSTGSAVRFTRRDKRTMPYIWSAALVLTVWPGVVLTDALIPASWGWIQQIQACREYGCE